MLFDLELEEQLAAALIRSEAAHALDAHITGELFSNDLFRALAELSKRYWSRYRELLEWPVVRAYLRQLGEDENTIQLYEQQWQRLQQVEITNNAQFLVDTLTTYAQSRRIDQAFTQARDLFDRGRHEEAQKIIYQEASRVMLERNAAGVERGEFYEDFQERLDRVLQLREHPELRRGMRTGINLIDTHAGGTWPKDFNVVFGESSAGKSMLLGEIARTCYLDGYKVLVITIEMGKGQWQRRADARISQVPYNQFKFGSLTEEEEARWKRVLEQVKECYEKGARLFITYTPYCTPETVRAEIEYYISQGHKPDLLIVDQLNIMTCEATAYSESQQLGILAKQLKAIAGQYELSVWSAAQKKTTSYRKGKMDLDDMGYSMQIIHNADVVLGMTYFPDIKELELALLKQRDGIAFITERVIPDFTYAAIDSSSLFFLGEEP